LSTRLPKSFLQPKAFTTGGRRVYQSEGRTAGGAMMRAVHNFEGFCARAEAVVNDHPVVVENPYTKWFSRCEGTWEEVRHLAVQFSVFSHLFVEAQLRKVINAPTLDQYRTGKEILMNELGVVFQPSNGP